MKMDILQRHDPLQGGLRQHRAGLRHLHRQFPAQFVGDQVEILMRSCVAAWAGRAAIGNLLFADKKMYGIGLFRRHRGSIESRCAGAQDGDGLALEGVEIDRVGGVGIKRRRQIVRHDGRPVGRTAAFDTCHQNDFPHNPAQRGAALSQMHPEMLFERFDFRRRVPDCTGVPVMSRNQCR